MTLYYRVKRILTDDYGLSLVEIIIALIFSTFVLSVLFLIIRPTEYVRVSRDTQRRKDIDNLQSAVDSYMNSEQPPSYVPGFNPDLPKLPSSPPFIPLDQISSCKATINCCTTTDATHSGWLAPIDPDDPLACPSGPNYPLWAVDLSEYLENVPLDPINNDTYHYRYQSDESGNKYSFTAKYESNSYNAKCYQVGTFLPKNNCWGP